MSQIFKNKIRGVHSMYSGFQKRLDELESYALADYIENKAFIGIKGVGKTYLFTKFFCRENVKRFEQENKYLFARADLLAAQSSDDIFRTLFISCQERIDDILVPDVSDKILNVYDEREKRNSRRMEMSNQDRLKLLLKVLSDTDYKMILVIDNFNCLSRNTEIRDTQYRLFRSLSEENLLRYWIISDSDFSDTNNTSNFIDSFFVQNFQTNTIQMLSRDDVIDYIKNSPKNFCFTENQMNVIYDTVSGIPKLIDIALEEIHKMKNTDNISKEQLASIMLKNSTFLSLMDSWCKGLTEEQKQILSYIAEKGVLYDSDIDDDFEIRQMNSLADSNGGVGLCVVEIDFDDCKEWRLNSFLFREYVNKNRCKFVNEQDSNVNAAIPEISTGTTYNVINNFAAPVNIIRQDISMQIDSAVDNLKLMSRILNGSNANYPRISEIQETFEALNFSPDNSLSKDNCEAELEKRADDYADKIFNSIEFSEYGISEEQKSRFCLTDDILNSLSDDCKKEIICGINVYDIIEKCIGFGLKLNSESPRGILFARAVEGELKNVAGNALKKMDFSKLFLVRFGSREIMFKDCNLLETTMGTYSFILKDRNIINGLASLCRQQNMGDKNFYWWRNYQDKLRLLTNKRNDCCHCGHIFNNNDLLDMINYIFKDGILANISLFDKISQNV